MFDGEDPGLTIKDVFERRPSPEPVKLDEARTFLLDFLGDGPKWQQDIVSAGKRLGISERTLQRAQRALHVVSREQRDPAKGKIAGFVWELPTP